MHLIFVCIKKRIKIKVKRTLILHYTIIKDAVIKVVTLISFNYFSRCEKVSKTCHNQESHY